MPEESVGWFEGTADAIRKFIWVLEVAIFFSFRGWLFFIHLFSRITRFLCTCSGLLRSERYWAHCNLVCRSALSNELHGTCSGTTYISFVSLVSSFHINQQFLARTTFRNMLMIMRTLLYHVLLLTRGKPSGDYSSFMNMCFIY
jgi:hypothetical protein